METHLISHSSADQSMAGKDRLNYSMAGSPGDIAALPGDVGVVPEPATWALLLAGLGWTAVTKRR